MTLIRKDKNFNHRGHERNTEEERKTQELRATAEGGCATRVSMIGKAKS
jgi:hypothetical protein